MYNNPKYFVNVTLHKYIVNVAQSEIVIKSLKNISSCCDFGWFFFLFFSFVSSLITLITKFDLDYAVDIQS